MTINVRPHTDLRAEPLLRWIFRRKTRALTCELDVRGHRGYDVCVVPHWDVSSSLIEPIDTARCALFRHAEIARRLREAGWVLAEHQSAELDAAAA